MSMSNDIIIYKWLAGGIEVYEEGRYDLSMSPEKIPIKLCDGLYYFRESQIAYWCGDGLLKAVVNEKQIESNDKNNVISIHSFQRLSWNKQDMIDYAYWCAYRAKGYAKATSMMKLSTIDAANVAAMISMGHAKMVVSALKLNHILFAAGHAVGAAERAKNAARHATTIMKKEAQKSEHDAQTNWILNRAVCNDD